MKVFASKIRDTLAFLVVSFFLTAFLLAITIEKFPNPITTILFLIFILSFIFSVKNNSYINKITTIDLGNPLLLIVGASFGAASTYFIATWGNLHLGTVIASSLVGVAGVVFVYVLKEKYDLRSLPLAIYCGSFVGMSAAMIISNIFIIAIAGALSGVIFVLSKNLFIGLGGKLGTLAFVATALTVFFLSIFGLR